MSPDYYVYVIFRKNGQPCYVGKGKGERSDVHAARSHNPHLNRIIRKSADLLPVVRVREHLYECEAFEIERALIAAIGYINAKTGPLVNQTRGGDGVAGHKRTKAQRAAMSKARKGRPAHPDMPAKVSAALKGRPKSEAHRLAVQAAKKGVKLGPWSEARRAAHKPRKATPEQVARQVSARMAAQALWSDEERERRAKQKSARISAKLKGKKLSPQQREAISRAQKGVPKGPWSEERKERERERRALLKKTAT